MDANAKRENALRYRLRDAAQKLTASKGVAKCGRALCWNDAGASVTLRVCRETGRSYFQGLQRCSSPWECAVCAPRIMSGRAAELVNLNRKHGENGGAAYLATLTLPHDEGDALRPMRKHVAGSWQRCISGAPWRRWQSALGVLGLVRAMEVTHGPNGWHCHLHVAIYTRVELTAGQLAEFQAWLYARWCRYIVRPTKEGKVFRAPSLEHGVRVEPLHAAEYLSKMGLEVSGHWTKEGREGHRTPLQILRDVLLTSDELARRRDVALWREWGRGMRGARQLTYSRGLAKLAKHYALELAADDAALEDTQTELELGAASTAKPAPAPDVEVHMFTRDEWAQIIRSRSSVRIRLALLEVGAAPCEEWGERIQVILDAALGLEPVPF